MDSITHAVFKAIAAEDAYQRKIDQVTATPTTLDQRGPAFTRAVGLQPLNERPSLLEAFAGAEPSDLHIDLSRGPELLALQMEFIAGGYCPPAGMALDGAAVVISPGRVYICASTDSGDAMWSAALCRKDTRHPADRRAAWEEQTS